MKETDKSPIMNNEAEPETRNNAESETRTYAEPETRTYAEPGTLYLCATPIGNLGDITERVLRTLESVDLIAAEDTRNTLRLLNHFGIKKPLTSYHEYNKYTKAEELVTKLHRGASIAVVTDAGTPAISDPGEVIAAMCLEQGIRVTSLPGACALITALTMSGMPARRFCFEGFLPADKKERRYILTQLQREERTTILYEAPHHLRGTLQELYDNLGDRRITLCRVLVLAGADRAALEEEKRRNFEEMTLEEHMALYTDQGLSRKDAMKKVAADRGVSKREIYKDLMDQ